jgi:hypothetical protein
MAEHSTTDGRIVGVVLDVSLRHHGGQRVLDSLKTGLVGIAQGIMQGDDLFYLYHPQIIEPVDDIGVAVGAIGNYETDGWLTDLRHALEQTFYVMAAEDADLEKAFIYITDRTQDNRDLKKLMRTEERDQTDCRFILVGVGQYYKIEALEELASESVSYFHIDDPRDLKSLF